MENENPIEEAKLIQSIEANDKLETIGKNTEASILVQDETKEAVKDLQPALDAIALNTEPKEVQKVKIEIEEDEKEELASAFFSMLKGKKGDKPSKEELLEIIEPLIPSESDLLSIIEPLIPEPIKGDDGDDYILTDEDKKDIASSIEVPIVEKVIEKTEVIRETPVTIDKTKTIVKEVAKYETPEQIVEKLNSLSKALDWKTIKNFPDFSKNGGSGLNTVFTDGTTIIGNGLADNPLRAVGGGGSGIQSIVAGTNITVDNTDPLNPIVSSTGGGLSTIENGVTTTTAFGADEILFSDGTVVRGNSKFTYNPTTNLFQVTDGTDRFLRISAGAKTFAIGDLDGAGPYIESSLSGNLLQFVATNLEMGGNQYVFPAVQGTAGQVLAVDSVSLGTATLDWVTPSGGSGITGSGANTQIAVWTGATTQAGYNAFTWNNATGRFQITNGASPAKRAFLVDAPTFDVAMGDISSGGNNTSLYVGDSSQNIQFLGGDGLGGTGAVLDIYTNLSAGNGAVVNMGDVSGLVNNTVLSVNDLIQQINMSGAPIGRMFRLDFAAGDALFGDFSLGTSGTDNVGSIQIGASGTFLMYGVDGLGTLSPFFASLGGGDYAWGDVNGVGSTSTLTFFESSGGIWSFNLPDLQFGGIDYRFPNAQGAKGQALVLSDGVGTLQYENVQRSWFEQTQSVTVAGTTTPTSVFGTGQGTRVIAANTVQVGSQYEIEIYGYYVAAVAQTLDYKIEMMGLSLSPGVTPIPPATVTNSAFRAKFTMTVRTLGASGQAILDGYVKFDNNNGTNVTYEFNSTSIHTIDTTSAHTNDFVPNWSSNSGSNSLTVLEASIKQTR